MKSALPPRPLVLVILIMVTAAFLGGILRLIPRAHAADLSASLLVGRQANLRSQPETALAADLTSTPLPTQLSLSTSTPIPVSADTGGMTALAIVIVATIVLGAAVGVRGLSPRKKPSKN